jgi:deoxyribonuclease-4
MLIGAHISKINNSVIETIEHVIKANGNSLQIFTGNPRSYNKANFLKYVTELQVYLEKNPFNIVLHCSYLINLATPLVNNKRIIHIEDTLWFQNIMADIKIANELKFVGCVVHVGKYTTQTLNDGLKNMKNSIRFIIEKMYELNYTNTTLILETACGAGTELLYKIEDLILFYNSFTKKEKNLFKICFDTCHVFASGYDIVIAYEQIQKETNKAITVIHLNDSKNEIGSKKDRHACLTSGYIPIQKLIHLVKIVDDDSTIIIETPRSNLMNDFIIFI